MNKEQYKQLIEDIKKMCTCPQIAVEVCNLSIQESGKGYRCASFLHADAHNQTSIYMEDSYWYSFAGNKAGDVISLVAYCKFDGNQGKAIQFLANYLNMNLFHDFNSDLYESKQFQLNEQIQKYHENLLNNESAMMYLKERHINEETIRRAQIGLRDAYYSREQNRTIPARIVIPMMKNNNVCYYTGRIFGQEPTESNPKYLKPVLDGFKDNDIYGLETLSQDKDYIVICEGAFDYLSFYQEGYAVLSNFGGAWSKNYQLKHLLTILRSFTSKNKNKYIVLTFDNDDSGKDFTKKMGEYLYKNSIPFKFACPPTTKDAYGRDVLREDGKPVTKDISDYYCTGGSLKELMESAEDGLLYLCKQYPNKDEFTNFLYPKRWFIPKLQRENLLASMKSYDEDNDIFGFGKGVTKDRNEWFKTIRKEILSPPTEDEITNEVLSQNHILHVSGIGWLVYKNQFWNHVDKEDIQKLIKEVLGTSATGTKLSNILTMIKASVHCNELALNKKLLMNFSNGTLELDTGIFRMPSKDDYLDFKLNYPYQKNKVSPLWNEYLNSVFDDSKKQILLQEYCGYCLSSDTKMEKALFLLGDGSNGKSVFLDTLNNVFGKSEDNRASLISSIGLDDMSDQFKVIGLMGKKVNVVFESKEKKRLSADEFKTIISGETVGGCLKYEQFKSFRPNCKHIFACNELPRFNDFSDAIERRMLILYFPYKFVSYPIKENEKEINLNLKNMTTSKEELSGIFNWCYEGYKAYKSFGNNTEFTKPNDMAGYISSYKSENDNLISFIEQLEMTRYDYDKRMEVPMDFISTEELYRRYAVYCEDGNFTFTVDRKIFDRRIAVCIEKYRPDLIRSKHNNSIRGYRRNPDWDDLPF